MANPVNYMERTRNYYRALGYEKDYVWARFDDVPFARLPIPLAQTRIGLVTTASPPALENRDAKGVRHVWSGSIAPPPCLSTPRRTTRGPSSTPTRSPNCWAWRAAPMPEFRAAPQDCEIRVLREGDLAAYKILRDGMLARHPDAFTSDAETEMARTPETYRSRLSGGANGAGLFTLGAWLGTRLVGAISAEREPRLKVRHISHIVGMMVSDEMQGQGIGHLLLECALRLLTSDTTLELATLTVTSSNRGAVRLYERCGFKRYGQLPGALKLPDGRLLDKDLMMRRLR